MTTAQVGNQTIKGSSLVTVSVQAEKLAALEMYLGQKNMKLPEELEKYSSCNSKWIYIILKVIFKRRYLK